MSETIEGIIRRIVREELERVQLGDTSTAGPMRWLTVSQAAQQTGHHPKSIVAAIMAGQLQGFQRHKGAHWRIEESNLRAWIVGIDE